MAKDQLTDKVIGLAIEVHKTLGPGLLESVYEDCLCQELANALIDFQRQLPVSVAYKGTKLESGFRADVVVEKDLLLEIKSVERLMPVHEAQVLTYLRFGGFSTGLLINFNSKLLKDGLKRFVL
ncbi:MAG: GxxExxY protein [Rhodospirillaceae bacterium]|nr:GxxExxY protein [Rhodospirillaceae bacterium]|tara:strand:- start:624 stop:995 length:372 start_codon:yes stop_codon:yes gene_type:complete